MAEPATVVLVHGAWHGPWCWEKVTALLDEHAVAHVEVELPFTSYEDDVAATTAALDAVDGAAVLCGHSYGGAVISRAGHHAAVRHLVYLTAFACDADESPAATAPDLDLPHTDLASALVIDSETGNATLDRDLGRAGLYHDCDPDDAASAFDRLRPIHLSCMTTPVGPPAWRERPATYVVCTEDRAIHPALQRAMAARCTTTVEWATAHSPFLNRPDLVAELLTELAT